jgi:XTP/dITP diphosphohydrolase
MPRIVLGTGNLKKLAELRALFATAGIEVVGLSGFPAADPPEEDGLTFADNARIKAVFQARRLQEWALGEDSGLAVDALGGRPGVHSARYAGPAASDARNNQKLLEELDGVPIEGRTAHYVCHMTLCSPDGERVVESEEICRGRIALSPRGEGGFGYDPLFELPEYHQTFGQLGPAVKSAISHRARAARQLLPQLLRCPKWPGG